MFHELIGSEGAGIRLVGRKSRVTSVKAHELTLCKGRLSRGTLGGSHQSGGRRDAEEADGVVRR